MNKKDVGVYLTVFSLFLVVLLVELRGALDPRWVWSLVRVGCLFLTIYALRLFAAGIKQEVRDELRGAAPTDSKPSAESVAAPDRGRM